MAQTAYFDYPLIVDAGVPKGVFNFVNIRPINIVRDTPPDYP